MKEAMKIIIAAGGTGGHIFPALSVALELKKQRDDISLLWIGTSRNREIELCEKHNIPIKILNVIGITRDFSFTNIIAVFKFLYAIIQMNAFYKNNQIDLVIAFGGYVCAPVLAAARFCKIPYFIHEQNSVPGLVNRIFSGKAVNTFLGFPLYGDWKLKGKIEITGIPVRTVVKEFNDFPYPKNFNKEAKTILICGGSHGASSMNDSLVEPVEKMLKTGLQVCWQTGKVSYDKIFNQFSKFENAFVFDTINNLYPFYAVSKIVICRAGASTLSEIAYFGIPCIIIPFPWATENHQWKNAGFVEQKGWGVKIAQDENLGEKIIETIDSLLSNEKKYEKMCQKALDNSPWNSAGIIAEKILKLRA